MKRIGSVKTKGSPRRRQLLRGETRQGGGPMQAKLAAGREGKPRHAEKAEASGFEADLRKFRNRGDPRSRKGRISYCRGKKTSFTQVD